MKVKSKFTLVVIVIVVAIATIGQVNNINKYDIFYVFNSKVDLISYIDMDSAHAGFELRDKVSVAYFEQAMRMHTMIPPQPPSYRYTSAKPAIIYLKNRGFIEVGVTRS
jgi:hypothetical protein